jgi:hypothetical protein
MFQNFSRKSLITFGKVKTSQGVFYNSTSLRKTNASVTKK